MATPRIGEGFRGIDGNAGFLLRQAWHAFRASMDSAVREAGLTSPQYAVLSVIAQEPGISGADLARVYSATPQAMNELLLTLERDGLVTRTPHPTHGRIRQTHMTTEGERRLAKATPAVRKLEATIAGEVDDVSLDGVKRWLVACAKRCEDPPPSDG